MDPCQQAIVDEFSFFEDWSEKYQYIIELGQKLEALPDKYRTPEYLVKGCQSQVWYVCEGSPDGRLHFRAASDSAIVQGLIAILLRIFNDKTPDEILSTKLECMEAIGLKQHLSMTRNNGLYAMLQRVHAFAKEHQV